MYSNQTDFSEKQDIMNALLEQKMSEFKLFYNETKRENSESRFILIVGRTPPPFEIPIQTKLYYDRFISEAENSISIENIHIFYMDLFMVQAIFISTSSQLAIKKLYEEESIVSFPLFIGSITKRNYIDFHNVFDAIIFDGGVCYNMSLKLIDIQHMLQYLHNRSSFLLVDSNSDNCEKELKLIRDIPILEDKSVEYYNELPELTELKEKPLKVTSVNNKAILFEEEPKVFDKIFQEFENAYALEEHLKKTELAKTHYFAIQINHIKRGDKYIAMINVIPKKQIKKASLPGLKGPRRLTECLPSETNLHTPEELEELKMRLIEWFNINGFEGQYKLIKEPRGFYFIQIQKQVGKSELARRELGRAKKRKTKRKKSKAKSKRRKRN